mmetsp:Transcript_15389/g.32389  ORF Transcript_15389/g.32389 Transcript_15389/m.32389 type:complete len:428 (+) Transcript_15389:84-1367(+)
MMPSSSTSSSSTPIPIQASEPIAINPGPSGRGNDCEDDDSVCSSSTSSSNDNLRRSRRTSKVSALSLALGEADSIGGEDMMVGSLPMHLRRSGRGVGGSSRNSRRQTRQQGGLSGSGIFMGPQSLPPPRAPFLSSRAGVEDKLSSIPPMALPESVSSNDPIASSVPYGSLRESRFAYPQQRGLSQNDNFGTSSSHAKMASSNPGHNSLHSFHPQSLPAQSGIGAYFNRQDNIASAAENVSTGSGIGGLLNEAGNNQQFSEGSGDIAGIMERCTDLQLNDDGESMNQRALPIHQNTAYENTSGFGGNNHDQAPLSSSLTALDILTMAHRNRGSHISRSELEPPSQAPFGFESNRNLETRISTNLGNEQRSHIGHQQVILHGPYFNHTPAQYTDNNVHNYDRGGSFDNDNDDNHANPDAFGAFDLELDE